MGLFRKKDQLEIDIGLMYGLYLKLLELEAVFNEVAEKYRGVVPAMEKIVNEISIELSDRKYYTAEYSKLIKHIRKSFAFYKSAFSTNENHVSFYPNRLITGYVDKTYEYGLKKAIKEFIAYCRRQNLGNFNKRLESLELLNNKL